MTTNRAHTTDRTSNRAANFGTTALEAKRSNRNTPVERWPESIEILRHLAGCTQPRSIRDIAQAVSAPEISTRNRLSKLEAAGAVRAHRAPVSPATGKPVSGLHYNITQHGRDCAAGTIRSTPVAAASVWQRASSVFSWGAAPSTGA